MSLSNKKWVVAFCLVIKTCWDFYLYFSFSKSKFWILVCGKLTFHQCTTRVKWNLFSGSSTCLNPLKSLTTGIKINWKSLCMGLPPKNFWWHILVIPRLVLPPPISYSDPAKGRNITKFKFDQTVIITCGFKMVLHAWRSNNWLTTL